MTQQRTILALFQIIMKTVQRKSPFIQRSESRDRADEDSPDSVCSRTRFTRCSMSGRSCPQGGGTVGVARRYIVSQQQYMSVDVPAEIQCQNTATHQNTVKDAQVQRQVQKIQNMPSEIHSKVQNMLILGPSAAAVQSPGPVLQISSRRQTRLR